MNTRGFTLIEILVVIAIIGILAGAGITGLSGSRAKSGDTTVQLQMNLAMEQIEIFYEDFQHYGAQFASATCPTAADPGTSYVFAKPEVQPMLAYIKKANGNNNIRCATGGTTIGKSSLWAIASPLRTTGPTGKWWCMDSRGYRGLLPNAGTPNLGGGATIISGATWAPATGCPGTY